MTTVSTPNLLPTIVRGTQTVPDGIRSIVLSSPMIGYIVRGKKYIYFGDTRYEIERGDLFYLPPGQHYTEAVPENGKIFEQISFFYTSDQLGQILNLLHMNYRFRVENDHVCPACQEKKHAVYPAWNAIRYFYDGIGRYLREGFLTQDDTVCSMKMTELIYLILSRGDCCLKNKIMENVDLRKENFEQIIHKNIFNDISVVDLSKLCNRSLTSFKKEFKKHFYESPHKWFIRQRLTHSCLLLVSTGKSIAQVGVECNFPNTSHFIKLFKKEYGVTPANYRNRKIKTASGLGTELNTGSIFRSAPQNTTLRPAPK